VKITLFIPCFIDTLFPRVGMSVVEVLEGLGHEIVVPEAITCCGQPAFNSGYGDEARKVGRHFVDLYRDREWIVTPSGSCCSMIKVFLPELLEGDRGYAAAARQISERTRELSDFLVSVLKVESTGASFPASVTYHDSCHLLRNLRVKEQPRSLLRKIAGAEFVEMNDSDRCCGFGGSFSFKYADISAAMAEDKVDNIIASGADTVVGCDMGCLMNIQGRLSRRGLDIKTMHIAQILAG